MYEQNDKLRDNIFGRHKEMERSSESIQRLIESLDKQKEEVIEKIFAQVSGFFSEIFEKLVPAGRGRLIMIKRSAAQVSTLLLQMYDRFVADWLAFLLTIRGMRTRKTREMKLPSLPSPTTPESRSRSVVLSRLFLQ